MDKWLNRRKVSLRTANGGQARDGNAPPVPGGCGGVLVLTMPQSACCAGKVGRSATNSTSNGVQRGPVHLNPAESNLIQPEIVTAKHPKFAKRKTCKKGRKNEKIKPN